jgi:UDP-N-acetylmuramate--alanine ligase
MEHHDSEADFIGCFERLIQNTKNKVYYCGDDPIAQRICSTHPKCESFPYPASRIPLPLPGNHNQWNAAAALAVCRNWLNDDEIGQAMGNLQPIRRRFETVYEEGGIRIVSDYAHHPTEIAALIQTAQELKPKRLLGIFQPHRYTRTRALGADFSASFQGLEKLWLVPVYAASEQPIEGGTTEDLMDRFPVEWNAHLNYSESLEAAWTDIQSELREGDLMLIIGAGDIELLAEWAKQL